MSGLFGGVDLGGTSIKGALADEAGSVVVTHSIPTESHLGSDAVLGRIVELIGELLANRPGTTLQGLGIGIPGLVDVATGTTRFLPNFPTQWRGIPVASILSGRVGCPVRLLNDVRAATLGELRYGHGRERPQITLAFFSIGTGIGGGLAIDGELRLGPLGAAGELGHQTIIPDGPRCGCGNRGCLEALASGPAIAAEGVRLLRMGLAPTLHKIVEGNADRVTTQEMVVASQHDKLVLEVLTKAAEFIGIAAANVVTVLHPDLIVLGGGVAEIGELLTDTVRKVISARVGMFPTDGVRVERSLLGERAGLMGAIALAREARRPLKE